VLGRSRHDIYPPGIGAGPHALRARGATFPVPPRCAAAATFRPVGRWPDWPWASSW
jgi:hypothetical protein